MTFPVQLCKIQKICKDHEKKKQANAPISEREAVRALGDYPAGPFLRCPG